MRDVVEENRRLELRHQRALLLRHLEERTGFYMDPDDPMAACAAGMEEWLITELPRMYPELVATAPAGRDPAGAGTGG